MAKMVRFVAKLVINDHAWPQNLANYGYKL